MKERRRERKREREEGRKEGGKKGREEGREGESEEGKGGKEHHNGLELAKYVFFVLLRIQYYISSFVGWFFSFLNKNQELCPGSNPGCMLELPANVYLDLSGVSE
jgi:flagellar biosynthesis/type III secretory pathway protein FliH